MALTFPLSLAQFWNLLPIASGAFDLPALVARSRTRGGELLRAEVGSRLWTADVRLGPMTRSEAAAVLPMLKVLRGAPGSFMAVDPLRAFPRGDAGGAALGAAAVTIRALAANARELSLKGLPASYQLQRGDMLAFTYARDPVRYALHQIVTNSVKAASDGTTALFEVVPAIRSGAAPDIAVSLAQPACKMLIDPDGYEPGTERAGGLVEGVTFRIQQSLR